MCDYSLHGVKNRLAVEGESLVVHKWPSLSKGLASPADIQAARPGFLKGLLHRLLWLDSVIEAEKNIPAVCIPPGAKLRLTGIPEYFQNAYKVGETEDVTFTQVTSELFRYRDSFRFANGETVLIQKFEIGVRVEVLRLALEEEPAAIEEREVVSVRG